MPFYHFIDGPSVDKYVKLLVDTVLTCCLWLNRKDHNRATIWWVQGFVQDQTLFCNQKNYTYNDGAQDYHDMLS